MLSVLSWARFLDVLVAAGKSSRRVMAKVTWGGGWESEADHSGRPPIRPRVVKVTLATGGSLCGGLRRSDTAGSRGLGEVSA